MFIFDTSTLILLAKAEVLREILENIVASMPNVVRGEATILKDRLDAQLIRQCIEEELIQILDSKEFSKAELSKLMQDFRLAEGEATALLFAQRHQGCLTTDDGPAIKTCKVLGIPFATAINLLVHAVRKGWISKEIALVKLEALNRAARYEMRIVQDARERITSS